MDTAEMQETWHCIVNPVAGSGKAARLWPSIADRLATSAINFTSHFSTRRGSVSEIVADLVGSGARKLVSVGGDGTHHEVVNGLMRANSSNRIKVAAFPIGTGNDWVRGSGLPKNPKDVIDLLQHHQTVAHSIGKITMIGGDEVYFINVAGMCLDAEVVESVTREQINRLGMAAYLIGGVSKLRSYRAYRADLIIDNDINVSGEFVTLHAGIGRFCGGGMEFTPHAEPSTGALAVTAIQETSKVRLLANIPRVYNGSIGRFEMTSQYTCSSLKISTSDERPIPIQADGEFIGNGPANIVVIPRAFDVCILPEL